MASMLLAVSASCGGGSDGEGVAIGPPAPPPVDNVGTLPITSANAQTITSSVLEAIVSSTDLIGTVPLVDIPVVAGISQRMPGLAARAVAPVSHPLPPMPCDTGLATGTWNDADDDFTISTGDSIEINFEMCFDAASGTTLDGMMSMTDIVVSGDPESGIAPWRMAMNIGFDSLTGTDASGTTVLDGAITFDLNSANKVVVNLTVTIDSLTVQQSGESDTLSNYVLTQIIDQSILTQTISANGIYTSTALNGSVTFETLQNFVVIGDDNPSSGQMLITDPTSGVLVTVLGNINVQLDVDTDLDGTVDTTVMTTWDELDIG
jgi:hypothetical protein